MADAVLGVVTQNVSSFLQKELSLFLGVNEDIEKMSSTLTAVQAVLEDAEEKQTTNRAIKDWLRKLKVAAYVLDDILDECSIKFTSARRDGDDDSGSGNEEHSMSMCSINPKTMLFRYEVAKRLKEISKRMDEIAQERLKFHLQERTMERRLEVPEWRQTSSIITQSVVYGRDEDRREIVDVLVNQASDCDELYIYAIIGIGGLGKTTLAQAVFNDERVSKHFDLKIWICVSDDFSLNRVLQSIIESSTGEHSKVTNLDSLQKKVQELLQSKKYLVVLDDVWNENREKWDRLKSVLNCGSKGASILVTTRLRNVATIMETCSVHQLSELSEDNNWSLFKQYAFEPGREEPRELVAIGKEIVRKCCGLPLAAKALGSLMRFKSGEKQWLDVKDSKLWDLPQEEDSILPALRLSYFHLPLDLRWCFSFCAIFPKDTEIKKETLIQLWMANGFVSSRNNLEMEDFGNMVCDELLHRSFFQDVRDQDGNIGGFKIHDLLHDLAHSVSGEDQCFISKKDDLKRLSRSAHHIGYLNNSDESFWLRSYRLLKLHKIERLRTFVQFHSGRTLSCRSSTTYSLRALKTCACLLSSLSHLLHLRYLDLDCGLVSNLPDSICNLKKLQTLKLQSCQFLCQLPNRLACLQDLRHLVIEDLNFDILSHMPPNMGKLALLKTLSVFIVGSKPGYRLAELHGLQLGGKLEIKGLENVQSGSDAEQANLIGKENLNSLCLSWGRDSKTGDVEQVLEALRPHSRLKHLGIKGYGGLQLPNWLRSSSIIMCLISLTLENFENCQQLPQLGKLPCLQSLRISGMKHVRYIDDGSYDNESEKAFQSLEALALSELPNLERVLKDEGVEMLPCLETLFISKVDKLTLPSIPSVEDLQVEECSEHVLKSISNYQGLRSLRLFNNNEMTFFPEGIMRNMCHLKFLQIVRFNHLKALPTDLNGLVSLEELKIYRCDELESFPEHMLQGLSSLLTLRIKYCKKLRSLGVVGHLTSLQRVTIGDSPSCILPRVIECFPCLLSLEIYGFGELESLPESLGDLTSLQKLEIRSCGRLRSLPSIFQRLRNLQKLYIYGCPKLEKRCKRRTGEDWHKIAHVPDIKLEAKPTVWEIVIHSWMLRSTIMKKMSNSVRERYQICN